MIRAVFNQITDLHAFAYRLTRGVVGSRLPGVLPPMLLLDHVGAKSGQRRTNPLAYIEDGEDIVIVASKGARQRNPAWFHNLQAHPETMVQVGSRRVAVRARVATAEERSRLWPTVVDAYDGCTSYQQRTERESPLVILEPRI
jgi:deazaflavin-dependent oxidoreductase (nitroreductase family)